MKVGLVVGSIALLIIVFLTFLNSAGKNTSIDKVNITKNSDLKETYDTSPLQPQNNHKYLTYSENVLGETADKRRVLFFYANWCPTCIPANKDFQNNLDKIPNDVALIRVNYNDTETDKAEKELARKYGVTYQHTFVQLDSSENKVKIWNGGQIDELLAKLQ